MVTTQKSLGRVLDEAAGIYQSRERGVFTFNVETGEYGIPDASFVPNGTRRKNAREKLILNFGDAFVLDEYIGRAGMWDVADSLGYGNPDTLRCMILYYILENRSNQLAQAWHEGSYASVRYPKANLTSQRISDLLSAVGDEGSQRAFFAEYFKLVGSRPGGEKVIIDSTGLPNSIHFPLTAVSNHNGKISNEVRLIYVVQQGTNLPLFFRHVPGNVIDVSTLIRTIAELKAHGIDTKFAILDAGYLTQDNLRELYEHKVSFLSRLQENRNDYRELKAEHLGSLESKEHLVEYNSRYVYVKRVRATIMGQQAYAYICRDMAMRNIESSKLLDRAKAQGMTTDEVFDAMEDQGVFILYSSRPIRTMDVLEKYYIRQQIEQVFDICKNNTNLLPLRVHSEDTFRGHLVLAFIASVIVKMLQDSLKKSGCSVNMALYNLGLQHCKVFDDVVLPCEPVKKVNDILKTLKIKYPLEISTVS
ncbi:hypothetical protein SDC9_117351 [bioreactor metagenome]|uniref:Transposase IS4-like domain-containing protein n=1 Tax=bioreactor metagenome TaxID=1076179 RepID=A0A645BY04_9ZZZZ